MTLSKFMQKWQPTLSKETFDGMLADLTEMFRPPEAELWVESTVSHRDMRPLVSVRFGKYQFQLDPGKAREIGSHFQEAAEASEVDSFLYQFFAGEKGIPKDSVGMMVAHFRAWRETHKIINAEPAKGPKQ